MRILILCLGLAFLLFSGSLLFAQSPERDLRDTTRWQLGLGVGGQFFAMTNPDTAFSNPGGAMVQANVLFRFHQQVHLWGQFAEGQNAAKLPIRSWGAGCLLEVTSTSFRPFFKVGLGALRVGGSDSASGNARNPTRAWSRMPLQVGLGAHWLASNGLGVKLEALSYNWRHPISPSQSSLLQDTGLLFYLGASLVKRF